MIPSEIRQNFGELLLAYKSDSNLLSEAVERAYIYLTNHGPMTEVETSSAPYLSLANTNTYDPEQASALIKKYIIAESFYKAHGWKDSRIRNHLTGIDFSKEVAVVGLNNDSIFTQTSIVAGAKGNYWATIEASPTSLGISDTGRVLPKKVESSNNAAHFWETKNKAAGIGIQQGDDPALKRELSREDFPYLKEQDPEGYVKQKSTATFKLTVPEGETNVLALKTTARAVIDTWSDKKTPVATTGGGVQYFCPSQELFQLIDHKARSGPVHQEAHSSSQEPIVRTVNDFKYFKANYAALLAEIREKGAALESDVGIDNAQDETVNISEAFRPSINF